VGEFLTDRECAEAIQFIRQNRDRPFFLYLAHHAVHTPLMGKTNVIAKYQAKADTNSPQHHPVYAALVESVDECVGRLLTALDEFKLADRTVIFFTSDNGGLVLNRITSNRPLRAGKGSAYEGGVRVPLLVRGAGVARPGRVCDVPVISVDFFPTMLELAGLGPVPGRLVDGVSLVPLLKGFRRLPREAIYWHYPHYHPGGATPYSAIRQGDWKLIEFFENNRVELYNLGRDIGESRNLADRNRGKREELLGKLRAWRKEVGAQNPSPNPDYEPRTDLMDNPRRAEGKRDGG
jgi:arylsulfatase A